MIPENYKKYYTDLLGVPESKNAEENKKTYSLKLLNCQKHKSPNSRPPISKHGKWKEN